MSSAEDPHSKRKREDKRDHKSEKHRQDHKKDRSRDDRNDRRDDDHHRSSHKRHRSSSDQDKHKIKSRDERREKDERKDKDEGRDKKKVKKDPIDKEKDMEKEVPVDNVLSVKKEPKVEAASLLGSLDVSSLLSEIAATKAALQEQQKKLQTSDKPLEPKSTAAKEIPTIPSKVGKMPTPTKPSSSSKSIFPPPLLLDAEGREVDAEGRVISTGPKTLVATAMINKRVQRDKLFKLEKPTIETDPDKNPYFDARMNTPKLQRGRRAFKFVEAGTYLRKAQRMRTKLAKELLAASTAGSEDTAGGLAVLNKIKMEGVEAGGAPLQAKPEAAAVDFPLGVLKQAEDIIKEEEEIPDVEWWDMPLLLEKEKYGQVGVHVQGKENINEKRIKHLVEHPYILQPPAEKPPPGPMPLKLTKEEQKKMRRRARAERLREQQERVLLGLEQPPTNRVRISNMMRVLGTEAVQDPTQIERMVREEMAQRVRNHEERNQARKLTPEEKRQKKLKKMKEDTSLISNVAIFKVLNLTDEKHRYKVDINAQENHLSGCALLFRNCNLIVVEGGPKAIERYKKLLLRRIDWNSFISADTKEEGDGTTEPEEKPSTVIPPPKDNKCYLLWEGFVLKPAFRQFVIEVCMSEKQARKFMKDRGVAHYWDFCRAFRPDLVPDPTLITTLPISAQ